MKEFTYESYMNLIELIRESGYMITDYNSWPEYERTVILRHDVDYDLDKATLFAEFESKLGIYSTYFVLLTGDFYNIFSECNRSNLKRILSFGHNIGLHFDETCYGSNDSIKDNIVNECGILGNLLGIPIKAVSMHRPSKAVLDMNIEIDGVVNSYGNLFIKEFKYISDSRRRWREPVEDIVSSGQYRRLQLLTHAFWYNDTDVDIHESVYAFINGANRIRYDQMNNNITDLGAIMTREEVR